MKILVTGGAGFIGSNIVDEGIKRGWEVRVIDNLSNGKKENLNPRAEFFEADICNLEKIKPFFEGADYVFHLAALARVQPSIVDPVTFNDANVSGTLNVLVAAKDAGVKKMVYSASSSAYGNAASMPLREDMPANPLSPYGLQKYIGELYCRLFSKVYGLPTACLRYFNVYGNRQSLGGAYGLVMGIFAKQRLEGKPLTINGDGKNRRDYTNVFDVVRANFLAAESEKVKNGESINIGTGRNYSINELAELIGGPKINLPPVIEPKETRADISLAKELLGWEPQINLADWIKDYKKELGI